MELPDKIHVFTVTIKSNSNKKFAYTGRTMTFFLLLLLTKAAGRQRHPALQPPAGTSGQRPRYSIFRLASTILLTLRLHSKVVIDEALVGS